jgi:hypothetical protein
MDDAWMALAACRGEPEELFFANMEAREPPDDAKAICDRCPVWVECLEFAQENDLWDTWGTWGGTSHWQRRQLRRRYRRSYCPVCRETGGVLIELGEAQACLSCAVSWRATPARSAR